MEDMRLSSIQRRKDQTAFEDVDDSTKFVTCLQPAWHHFNLFRMKWMKVRPSDTNKGREQSVVVRVVYLYQHHSTRAETKVHTWRIHKHVHGDSWQCLSRSINNAI